MKILVTGACGFVGSHYVRYLLATTDAVIVAQDRQTGGRKMERVKDLLDNKRIVWLWGDLAHSVGDALQDVDEVVHFAAETYVDNSIKDARPFMDSNVTGTFNLLEAARRWKTKRFVLVSTDEVYGPAPQGRFSEEAPLKPSNPYSATKAAADMLTIAYAVTYGLSASITRSGNIYGPWQHPEKAIPVFIKNALAGKPLPVYGDGRHVRIWLNVEDQCRGVDAVRLKGKPGEVYNVATDDEIENITLAKTILDLAGQPHSLIGLMDDRDIRPGHDRRYALDYTKIQTELGWKPQVGFKDGMARTFEWFKENAWWTA